MKRPGSVERTLERVKRWREICPGINVAFNLYCRFPGETEEAFPNAIGFLD